MVWGKPDRERVRALNDAMRTDGPLVPGGNRWLLTAGVLGLGAEGVEQAVQAVTTFTAFAADNDPYEEHDFGSFVIDDTRLFWKIDYYNNTLDGGSPDPSDPCVTVRVLTIMLPLEY
jgi:Protein of unknown function (DUF3768)